MSKGQTSGLRIAGLAGALFLLPAVGFCDDITDSINDGLKAYNEGEYMDSVESLNYAVQLILQKKSEGLAAFLPEALEGWEASDSSSQAANSAMFGGGITAKREYTKGDSQIAINFAADSPMLQGMMMMFSNPMFATSDGGKLVKIKRQKAIVKYNESDKGGEIMIIVDNRILVTINGGNVSLEDMKAYAEAIDYKKLEDS